MDEPADLYRYFDNSETLLYVGISFHAVVRAKDHRGKPWWPDVASMTVEHFPTRRLALKAERRAIETEQPLYNSPSQATPGSRPKRERTDLDRERDAERARRYRRRRGVKPRAVSVDPLDRARRKMRRGERVADLEPEEAEAFRRYQREYARGRRRNPKK